MNKSTRKKAISKVLENWYAIDSVLLNGHARSVLKEGSVFKEYTALKASLLSNLFEYWQKVQYSPSDEVPSEIKDLMEGAKNSAIKSKKLAGKLLKKESVKKKLKNIVMTEATKYGIEDINDFSDKVLQEKFLELSLDNLMIGLPVLESKNTSADCDMDCKILEDAHRMMRSSLVRLSLSANKM